MYTFLKRAEVRLLDFKDFVLATSERLKEASLREAVAHQRPIQYLQVNAPGMIPHDGQLTLARAVMHAGGPKSTAELRTVILLRDPGSPGAEPRFAAVDLNRLVRSGIDPLLQPYDVVFVPKSTIAKLNQFVDQYFVKVVPVTLSAGFDYTLGTVRNTQ